MRHLEVHVIETEQDVDLAIQAGLVTVDQLTHSECAECAEPIAHTEDEFVAFAIVLDERDNDWGVCIECASPLIDSFGTYSYTATFDEEEFETF